MNERVTEALRFVGEWKSLAERWRDQGNATRWGRALDQAEIWLVVAERQSSVDDPGTTGEDA